MSSESSVDRRTVLARGAAVATTGLVTISLPSAVAAYSVMEGFGGAVPTRPDDPTVAKWGGGNAATLFPSSSSTLAASATTMSRTISATMGLGGPFYSDYTTVNAATSGIAPANDNRFWFYYKYRAATLDVSDQNAPYLRWSITADSLSIALGYMFLGFNSTATTVASLRTSLDGYANSIRDFNGDGGSYKIVKIDLTSIPVIGPNSTISFRLYFYNTNLSSSAATVYLSGGNNPGLTAADSWSSEMGYVSHGFIHR